MKAFALSWDLVGPFDQMLICMCDFPPTCPLGENFNPWGALGGTDPFLSLLLTFTQKEGVLHGSQAKIQMQAVVLRPREETGMEMMEDHLLLVSYAAGLWAHIFFWNL